MMPLWQHIEVVLRLSFFSKMWVNVVPLKIFSIWQAAQDRIPSLQNLVYRKVLREEDVICKICEDATEDTTHILMECKKSWNAWSRVLDWWVLSASLHTDEHNFFQFRGLIDQSIKQRWHWCLVWYAVLWIIWKSRNDLIFSESERGLKEMLEKIQVALTWEWNKAAGKFNYSV